MGENAAGTVHQWARRGLEQKGTCRSRHALRHFETCRDATFRKLRKVLRRDCQLSARLHTEVAIARNVIFGVDNVCVSKAKRDTDPAEAMSLGIRSHLLRQLQGPALPKLKMRFRCLSEFDFLGSSGFPLHRHQTLRKFVIEDVTRDVPAAEHQQWQEPEHRHEPVRKSGIRRRPAEASDPEIS